MISSEQTLQGRDQMDLQLVRWGCWNSLAASLSDGGKVDLTSTLRASGENFTVNVTWNMGLLPAAVLEMAQLALPNKWIPAGTQFG